MNDPCSEPVVRFPFPGGRTRVRVVEVLATGSNGGAQEHLFNLLSRIDNERYEVSVLALSGGAGVRKLERFGIPVCVLEPDPALQGDAADADAVEAVAAHLAAVGADVVHNHMYRAEIVGTRAAWRVAERGGKRPFVVGTVHSSRVRSNEDRELVAALTPRMDHLIAVSQAIVRKIADEGRIGPPVTLIYNGVDLDRYDKQEACCTLREEYGLPEAGAIVGVVARLEPEKGHPSLLEAWPIVLAEFPTATLLVIGEGSRREALEAQAAALGPDVAARIVFTGRRDDVPAVTAALDVAVLPSYREAQGLSILEAMALSRPVVATAVGGIPEMIEDEVTGILVAPHDAAALGGSIARLLRDHPLADTLARNAHDLVHERFCVELMVRAVESIYDEAIGSSSAAAAAAIGLPELAAG